MNLKQLFKFMFLMTLICLMYTYLQMRIVELAYQAKKKEKIVRELVEENSVLTSAILRLKSSSNLGVKVGDKPGMQFLASKNVVEVKTVSLKVQPQTTRIVKSKSEERLDVLLSYLPFRSQAEAKPLE